MPSLMVYTEECFYYRENIHVVAKQEFMNPDVTNLNFYNEFGFWFGIDIGASLYSSNDFEPILEEELRRHGHSPELQYSRKHLEYSYSDKRVLDTVDCYITKTERKNVLAVMEQINHSKFLKNYEVNSNFHDYISIRQFTDSIFYSMFTDNQSE